MNCKIDIDRFICFLIENKSDAKQLLEVCLKAQGLEYKNGEIVEIEQPPLTEEQKPKFKVGDWITSNDKNVHNDYRICKISKIKNDRYYIDNEEYLYKDTIEQYDYHIWTVKDAKPGDVLYCKTDSNNIKYYMLFKQINTFQNIDTYCRFNSVDGFGVDVESVASTKSDNITPATTEQRDLLFKKMEEAGYIWNQDTLTLEKKRLFSTIRFDESRTKDELIELRDDKGEKVLMPKKKFLEKVNEIRNEEDDYIWPKDIIDQMHNEIAAGTPKVEAELKKYFANIFPYLYNVDVDKMVEEYKEEESKVLLPLGFSKGNIEHLSIAYKNGIEDMLKLIKGGGNNG